MNLSGLMEELRSELQHIEEAIRSLEQFNPLSTGSSGAGGRSAIEIRRVTEPDGSLNSTGLPFAGREN
jgi:hypothetical protein